MPGEDADSICTTPAASWPKDDGCIAREPTSSGCIPEARRVASHAPLPISLQFGPVADISCSKNWREQECPRPHVLALGIPAFTWLDERRSCVSRANFAFNQGGKKPNVLSRDRRRIMEQVGQRRLRNALKREEDNCYLLPADRICRHIIDKGVP